MGMHRQHLADALERLLGLALLDEADDGVDDHHAEDDAGVDPVAEGRRDRGGAEQHVDEHVVEVLEEALEQSFPGRLRQAVGADFGEAACGLVRAQALGAGTEMGEHLVGSEGVGAFEVEAVCVRGFHGVVCRMRGMRAAVRDGGGAGFRKRRTSTRV